MSNKEENFKLILKDMVQNLNSMSQEDMLSKSQKFAHYVNLIVAAVDRNNDKNISQDEILYFLKNTDGILSDLKDLDLNEADLSFIGNIAKNIKTKLAYDCLKSDKIYNDNKDEIYYENKGQIFSIYENIINKVLGAVDGVKDGHFQQAMNDYIFSETHNANIKIDKASFDKAVANIAKALPEHIDVPSFNLACQAVDQYYKPKPFMTPAIENNDKQGLGI